MIILVNIGCFTDPKSAIISSRYHIPVILGLGLPLQYWHMSLVVWVLWGEIKVDFDDLKHIVHLIGRFYELGNGTMTCLHDHRQVL